jgi:decaprenylphospho-beta-D-erythro-pentofuranosid-2-ulose 2-reductase
VATPMTAGHDVPGLLVSSPRRVAGAILRQIERRRATTIYVPWYWRWVMLLIRLLPARLMHRTSL